MAIQHIIIEYSPDSGSNWYLIEPQYSVDSGSYDWTAPNTASDDYLVRIYDSGAFADGYDLGDAYDVSDAVFTISYTASVDPVEPDDDSDALMNTNYTYDCTDKYTTYREITLEVWKRILNNLPHLYKTKGTIRGLKSLITCYGIPSSLLYVREYGGPDVSESVWNEYKFDNYSHGGNFNGSSSIEFDWQVSNNYSRYPSTVQFRFIASESEYTLNNTMSLVGTEASWSLNLIPTSDNKGKIEFILGSISMSTEELPIYDNKYTSINLQRESASDGAIDQTFNLDVKKYMFGSLLYQVSASMDTVAAENVDWRTDGTFYIGSSSTYTFFGGIDELRFWDSPLIESVINSHTKYPQSVIGNTITASFNELLLRLSFDNPINFTDDIMTASFSNLAPSRGYNLDNLTFKGWTSETIFPYNFKLYEYESEAHPINLGTQRQSSNKVRIENTSLVSDLRYDKSSEVGQYDLSQIDSNKLGIYFSPTDPINEDIIKNLAINEAGDLIGNPSDLYSSSYSQLNNLSALYWNLVTRRITVYDYLNYIRFYDASLFDHIRWMVPARAKLILGILMEPTLLERPKAKYIKPNISSHMYDVGINMPTQAITSSYDVYEVSYDMQSNIYITGSNFEKTNIYTIIDISSYTDGVSGSVVEQVVPVIDFDNAIIFYDLDQIRTPRNQLYSFTTGYHPRHYKNYSGYYIWERRLKHSGCHQTLRTTLDQKDPVEVWIVGSNILEARDDGRSYLQVK